MSIDLKKAGEDFEDFLMIMDDQLDWLDLEAEKFGIDLDYSIESLSELEKLFELMSPPDDLAFDSVGLAIVCARYLGEVFCRTVGGAWELCLDDPKNVYYNQPVILGWNTYGGEFPPLSIMRSYEHTRRSGFVLKTFKGYSEPSKPLDLSAMVEE